MQGENRDRWFLEDGPNDQTIARIRLEWAPGLEPAAEALAKQVRRAWAVFAELDQKEK